MAKRKSTGKRLRFEIFKRDGFTCQYCGAQPPSVVLVADHIVPVIEGGETKSENLITACEPCNQGKAGRPLTAIHPRPDADLLYLETQQEIAELRRYQASRAERDALLSEVVRSLQQLWLDLSGLDWYPSDLYVRQVLARYSVDVVERAISDVALKEGNGYLSGDWSRYLWAVAKTMAQELEYQTDEGS